MNGMIAEARLLLLNDVRLLLRDLRSNKAGIAASGALVGIVLVILHAILIAICLIARKAPPIEVQVTIWAFLGFMMLGATMANAIRLVFEQRDLDLLFASPIRPESVLLARILGIVFSALLSSGILALPLINGAAIGLSWRFIAAYPAWLFLALIASALGTSFALAAVRVLGAHRARTWVQIVAGVVGASVYVVLQSGQYLRNGGENWLWKFFSSTIVSPPTIEFAKAAAGNLHSLLLVGVVAIAAALLSTGLLAHSYLLGVQESTSHAPKRRRWSRRYRIRTGEFRATFSKDLRLIRRDPLLLSQILPSVMYVFPAFFALRQIGVATLLAPVSVVIAVQFSMLLTGVAVDGEEGLDLILSSPLPEIRLRGAKMAAGMAVPLGLAVALNTIVAITGRAGLAVVTLLVCTGTASACTWLSSSEIQPTPRKDILNRKRRGTISPRGIASGILMVSAAFGVGLQAANALPTTMLVLYGVTALGIVACFIVVSPRELTVDPQGE